MFRWLFRSSSRHDARVVSTTLMIAPRRLLGLLMVSTAVLGTQASAQTYQPLDVGARWIYGSQDGLYRDTVVVVGPTIFDETSVTEIQYHGYDNGLSNFWSVDTQGRVLLHGFDRPAESFAVHYVPPICMVPSPVQIGQTSRDTVYDHCLRTPCPDDTLPFTYLTTVTNIGSVTVPAGTFTAATVELGSGLATASIAQPHTGYSILGTRIAGSERSASSCCGQMRWWAEGVGFIRDYAAWELLSFDFTTPIQATSWGRVKAAYR